MGNKNTHQQSTTKVVCNLTRTCVQAGNMISGTVDIMIGDSDKQLFQNFNQGAVVELKVFGEESVFWANGHKHNHKRQGAYINQITANDKRESANILHEFTHQLPITVMELSTKSNILLPFQIPLPDNLPSSFMFCGPDHSIIKIQYSLDISFIGLKSCAGTVPEATLLYTEKKFFKLRMADGQIIRNNTYKQEGKLSATFGSNGESSIQATIPSNTYFQDQPLPIAMVINNQKSKCPLDQVRISVLREIIVKGRTFEGADSDKTIASLVIMDKIPLNAVAGCSNLIPVDSQLPLANQSGHAINKDDSRALYLTDVQTGQPLPMELKAMQHEFLPTTDTSLIKCNYELEIKLFHKGKLKKFSDVPEIKIPIVISRNPEGPLETILYPGLRATQQLPQQQLLVDTQQIQQQHQQPMFSYDYNEVPQGLPPVGAPMGEPMDLPPPVPLAHGQSSNEQMYYPQIGQMAGPPMGAPMAGPPMGGAPMTGPPMGGAPMVPPDQMIEGGAVQGFVMDEQAAAKKM